MFVTSFGLLSSLLVVDGFQLYHTGQIRGVSFGSGGKCTHNRGVSELSVYPSLRRKSEVRVALAFVGAFFVKGEHWMPQCIDVRRS